MAVWTFIAPHTRFGRNVVVYSFSFFLSTFISFFFFGLFCSVLFICHHSSIFTSRFHIDFLHFFNSNLIRFSFLIVYLFVYLFFIGNRFNFYPKEGSLQPGDTETITINFESDLLGEFCEIFRFALQGNEHMLECKIKGNIIGPTFHFDCNNINYNIVSYDYLNTKNIRLYNTSAIPIVFNLHVPQDGGKKEFDILPSRGTLLSGMI